MALDAATAQEMLRRLAEDRATYLSTLTRAEDLLSQALAASAGIRTTPQLTSDTIRRNTGTTFDVESVQNGSTTQVDSDSDTDDDESLFVQQSLPPESYDEQGLREHIKTYRWTESGREILGDVLKEDLPSEESMFPRSVGAVADRSHLTHYSIFDVGNDGAPLPIRPMGTKDTSATSRATAIWENIRKTNADPERQRLAVGRITIVREPSAILFAALHYTMNKHFDVDGLFQLLYDEKTRCIPHQPFAPNPKQRNTFVFSFDYYTIVGDECKPMTWQKADEDLDDDGGHIPVSRCSSVVALQLASEPIAKVRNKGRRVKRIFGDIHDPFAPWRILSIQCYPDWKSSVDSHDSTKHYVNGPEAFLVTLRAEYKDAQKRLKEVYNRISDLVRTPADFMFKQSIRDRLLFEDDDFTYSRRYFWAHQSLGIMNEDINEIITAYRETFKEKVRNGTDKIIWPGDENTSSRHANWRKRMKHLRQDIEHELEQLGQIEQLNLQKMKEIRDLRDNLFSGTSVLESRRSVMQATITVQQGHNIKLLTLVTIFFLPLTFVTSIFGMTNMPPTDSFHAFGIVTAIICLPTYMLIGSLNTTSGLKFWTHKTRTFFTWIGKWLAKFLAIFGYRPSWTHKHLDNMRPKTTGKSERPARLRSQSATDGMAARGGLGPLSPNGPILSPQSTMSPKTTIKIEARSRPRSLIEKADAQDSSNSSASAAEPIAAVPPKSDARPSNGWLPRLWNRKSKVAADDRELC
ncbi:hypothetical protein G7Y79_00004g014840 [Physcia stellaris]|nr:hypothetical protein G7Y79_00004g014840 [Physcia stellaris]